MSSSSSSYSYRYAATAKGGDEEVQPRPAPPSPSPFRRLNESDLSPAAALEQYRRYGFLWVRLDDDGEERRRRRRRRSGAAVSWDVLRELYSEHPRSYERRWTVENRGQFTGDDELSAAAVLGGRRAGHGRKGGGGGKGRSEVRCSGGAFYVSTIIRGRDGDALRALLELLPFGEGKEDEGTTTGDSKNNAGHEDDGSGCGGRPALLGDSKHDGGCWLFVGSNPPSLEPSSSNSRDGDGSKCTGGSSKRKREATGTGARNGPLAGRAEHVDEVRHSGTWHVQLSGTKTWLVRPNAAALDDWAGSGGGGGEAGPGPGPPDITGAEGAERSERGGRAWRLRVAVEAGDLLVLNTRAWYHRTEIDVQRRRPRQGRREDDDSSPPSEDSSDPVLSVSIARDFYLPAPPPVLSERDYVEGEVVLDEDDIPDDLPRSSEFNCALAEVEEEGGQQQLGREGGGGDAVARIILVALRDIRPGEPLTLQPDGEELLGDDGNKEMDGGETEEEEDDEEGGDGDDRCNAPDGIDPRAVCTRTSVQKGELVLRGDDIPEELPCSSEPSCELVEDDATGEIVLVALRDISEGEVLSVIPEEGTEYDEVEVDLRTGEIVS